mgnify:FL=1
MSATASLNRTQRTFGAISPKRRMITVATRTQIVIVYGQESPKSEATPDAATVAREDIQTVTIVVPIRFTINNLSA